MFTDAARRFLQKPDDKFFTVAEFNIDKEIKKSSIDPEQCVNTKIDQVGVEI